MVVNLAKNQEQIIPLTSLKDFSENLTVNLNGENAKVTVAGILMAKGADQVNFNIAINHNAPNTFSDTLIRSVLEDKAQVSLQGMVRIKKGAKGTNTYLKEDALMLSPDARAFALPCLEINENEVKAGHSSAVGPVDQEQLFYLMTKGIPLKEAQKLVVQGYLYPALQKMDNKTREKIQEKLIND